MERVAGVPLTEHPLARGPVRGRMALALQVCDAVHYAHQRGVIHRDLKPGNVLVDAEGRARVLDFGIARRVDVDAGSTATGLGEVLGSLAYMSPEQVAGDPLDVDVRSDVYALGVMLHELLAGRRPLALDGRSFPAALRIILNEEPPRLGTVDPALAGDLETIVAKALEKEKEQRYASAAALADDLRRYLADEPIAARPASAVYQLRKFARRNRALAGGAALAAAALAVGTGVSTWQAVRATAAERAAEARRGEAVAAREQAEERRREAVGAGRLAETRRLAADSARALAEWERLDAERARAAAEASAGTARREAAKAEAVNAFLTRMLASGDPENARGRTVTVRDVVDEAARRVGGGSLRAQPDVEGAVRASLANTYLQLGDLDSARVQAERAYALHRGAPGAARPELAGDALLIGKALERKGDFAGAEARYEEARTILRQAGRADGERMMVALQNLGYVRYTQARHTEAEHFYSESVRLAQRRVARALPGDAAARLALADARQQLGEFLNFVGRPGEAEPIVREALAAMRAVHGELHPDVARAEMALAYILYRRDREDKFAEAVALGRLGLAHVRALYGDEPRVVAEATSRLASALLAMDSVETAEPLIRQTIAMRRRALGEAHPDVAYSRTELGRLLQRRRRFAEADSLFTQALVARRAALGERHPAAAASLQDLGRLAMARGDTAAALPHFLQSAEIWRAAESNRSRWPDALAAARAAAFTGRAALADSLLDATAASDTTGVIPFTAARLFELQGSRALARGATDVAERAWLRADAVLRDVPGTEEAAARARLAALLAALYERRGRAAEAASWRARAVAP
jgi:non-specific serine/threonine protein kinase/serine/threonine-protein kinase